MSRIGKKIIVIPSQVKVEIKSKEVLCKGPKGNLSYTLPDNIDIDINENIIQLSQSSSDKQSKSLYGLARSLVNNLIIGVSEGFSKRLELQGVGYRSQISGQNLILNVGYSHPVTIEPPQGIKIEVENNTNIIVSGIDKQAVGQMAAVIRSIRPPEPYKGKGIRYLGEKVQRKVGKTGKK
uniref:ribosomal protein L6 n=1 Tax=Erythrolobus coxiae TaxID=362235 RepID=UPI001FCD4BCC|nr:ribosomal protein L6 [Erythrolobus coxiae]UNJ17747.1 ribosomal protein L6 [Erythrolobus coxiae]